MNVNLYRLGRDEDGDNSAADYVTVAVRCAMHYWPNAHLGDCTPREDMRSAFRFIRAHLKRGVTIHQAAMALEHDAFAHADM